MPKNKNQHANRSRPSQSQDHSQQAKKQTPQKHQKSAPFSKKAPTSTARPSAPQKAQGQKRDKETSNKLQASILRLIAERPFDAPGIASALDLPPAWRGKLLHTLKEMEMAGDIARIRKDRYIIPQEADLFTGVIQFHASGAAHILNEKAGDPDIYISAENYFTSMNVDRVVAMVITNTE